MKCPNCGCESESKFCPDCGTMLKNEKTCPKCGTVTESRFCPNCGQNLSEDQTVAAKPLEKDEKKSKKKSPVIPIVIVILIAVIGCFLIVVHINAKKTVTKVESTISEKSNPDKKEDIDAQNDFSVEGADTKEAEVVDEKKEAEDDDGIGLDSIENEGKLLPGGVFVAGEDISVGKYNLKYTTEMSDEDYWSNDYLYILRSGSEGSNETLGGMKYDERFGSVDYDSAKEGKSFFMSLKTGDKIEVSSEFGTWTFGCTESPNLVEEIQDEGNVLPGGVIIAGEDISVGRYSLTYTTEMDEKDYWSNDYLYINRKGSEGKNETLGGMKYDERFGSTKYSDAKNGKKYYMNLKEGDRIEVNTEFGTWTYGSEESPNAIGYYCKQWKGASGRDLCCGRRYP